MTSVRTVDLQWGEWLYSSADFNPNHNHVNAAPKPPDHFTSTIPCNPKSKVLYINVLVLVPILICEIKLKKSGIGHQIFN